MNLYFKLLNKPVFRMDDVNKYYDNITSARSAIRRLLNAGMVKKIRNDLYTCVSGENGAIIADRFQIGCAINEGAYISHHSAMEYYGITDQVIYDVYISSQTAFNDFEFEGYRYHHVKPNISQGVQMQEFSGGVIVTDRERTALDCIKDMDKISGAEEVISNIESLGRLQEKRLLMYLKGYDNQFLYQKTGFLLETSVDKHGLSETFFDTCRNKAGKSKRYFTALSKGGSYNSTWKLVVPKNLFNMKNGE
nr:type IV toxin-antitoxin system AbiEi family antitoxin [Butyrivibrio sp. WCD3002]